MVSSILLIAFALLAVGLAAADVSHLSKQYLPPSMKSAHQAISIEQQELQELPEQIEYVQPGQAAYGGMEASANMPPFPALHMQPPAVEQYLPPAASAGTLVATTEQPMSAELGSSMLPPAMREYIASAAFEEAEATMQAYLPPEATAATPLPTQQSPERMMAAQYLPPAMAELPQLTFKKVMQPLLQAMPESLPEAPTPTQVASEPESVPAHILAGDGYHYKTGGSSLDRRFRL